MDIKIFNTLSGGEISVNGGEPIIDNAFDSAIYISFFTDRNWYGEKLGELQGSRIYEIKKNSNINRIKLKEYIKESLKWLLNENIASKIEVLLTGILQNGVIYDIIITQPTNENKLNYKFSLNWENQSNIIERIK